MSAQDCCVFVENAPVTERNHCSQQMLSDSLQTRVEVSGTERGSTRLEFCFRLMSDKNELQEYIQFHGSCDVRQHALFIEDCSHVVPHRFRPIPRISTHQTSGSYLR